MQTLNSIRDGLVRALNIVMSFFAVDAVMYESVPTPGERSRLMLGLHLRDDLMSARYVGPMTRRHRKAECRLASCAGESISRAAAKNVRRNANLDPSKPESLPWRATWKSVPAERFTRAPLYQRRVASAGRSRASAQARSRTPGPASSSGSP